MASHLIYEGLVDEGLSIVKGLRARHDGLRRNPWNEFECGSHYARSLASWSLLTALSGYQFDLPHGVLGFSPRLWPERWQSFWSTGTGWGIFGQCLHDGHVEASLRVEQGSLTLRELHLGSVGEASAGEAAVDDQALEMALAPREGGVAVRFPAGVTIQGGQSLRLSLQR